MKTRITPTRAWLTIVFAIMVFVILTITMMIVGFTFFFLVRTGIIPKGTIMNTMFPVFTLAFTSILVGTIVATILSRIPLKPLNTLINGMDQLASGNYEVRIDLGNFALAQRVAHSFNTLASELQNTEILRSDFINNFSHEFKTPIVSIRGFAKLLQKGNLPVKQQQDYLNIIMDESTRLTDLATNVLQLTQVENQQILTDITQFNLSEQIRNSVLLLEKKWNQKNLAINADFNEYYIEANEEMLMQVWVNLIDNAIKFSPPDGAIDISIYDTPNQLIITVKNNGPVIDLQAQKRLFDKFWQADPSRTVEGTGIGLSIAKRIVDLHHGNIQVQSIPNETIFTVLLPL